MSTKQKMELNVLPKLYLFGLCNNDKCVYIFGGTNNSTFNIGHYTNNLWEYNIETNTIKCIDRIEPELRISLTLNYYNNCLYLFGGYRAYITFYNDLWKYCIKDKHWRKQIYSDDIPHKRSDHRSIIYDHYLIIFGGVTNGPNIYAFCDWKCLNDLWYYDMKNEKWKYINCSNKPSERMLHGMMLCQNNIIVHGGCDNNFKTFQDTYLISVNDIINDSNPKWIRIEMNVGPLYSHMFLSYNNKYVMFQ